MATQLPFQSDGLNTSGVDLGNQQITANATQLNILVNGEQQWAFGPDGALLAANATAQIEGASDQTVSVRSGSLVLGTADNTAPDGTVSDFTLIGGDGGDGTTPGAGGQVVVQGGVGGNGDDGANGGNVMIVSGAGGTGVNSAGAGGKVLILSADGIANDTASAGDAGAIEIIAGSGGNTQSGTASQGGTVTIASGPGGSATISGTSEVGGNIDMTTGQGGVSIPGVNPADSGSVNIITANGTAGADTDGSTSGRVRLVTGAGGSSAPITGSIAGESGTIDILTGAGGEGVDDGTGASSGDINIRTGNAGDNQGNAQNAARGGYLKLRTGRGGSGVRGSRGGSIDIVSGDGGSGTTDTGSEGAPVGVSTGDGGNSDDAGAGYGGSFDVVSGNGGDSTNGNAGNGGSLDLASGNGGTSQQQLGGAGGTGGFYLGEGGNSTDSAGGTGGRFIFRAGPGGTSINGNAGDGGNVSFELGNGGNSSSGSGGDGGSFTVLAGNGGYGDQDGAGGNITLTTQSGNITLTTQSGTWTFDNGGNLTLPGSSVIRSVPNSSGDGSGYSTLHLVPDPSTNDDRYIIVDPTGPDHIHLRAGGAQDGSSALLYLGGEQAHAMVDDNNHEVTISAGTSYFWKFDNTGNLILPILRSPSNLGINFENGDPAFGNIASTNFDGNVSNVLSGDGTWIAAGGGGGGGGGGTSWTSTASIAVGDIFTGHTIAEIQPGQTYTPTNTGNYFKVVSNFIDAYINIIQVVWFPAASLFVAVGNYSNPTNKSAYLYSDDGFTWQHGEFPTTGTIVGLAASPTLLVAVTGPNSSTGSKISTDGINWTEVQGPVGNTSQQALAIAYGAGVFVAMSQSNAAWTSTDGSTWTQRNTSQTSGIRNVSFVNDRFLAVMGTGQYSMSMDGITWTASGFTGSNTSLDGAAYAFGVYAVLGSLGLVRTTTDFVTWTDRATRMSFSISLGKSVIQMGPTLYITSGQTIIVTTTDWVNYKTQPISTIMGAPQGAVLNGLATDGNKVVGVGSASGTALTTLSSMAMITNGIYTNQLSDPVPAGTYRCLGRAGDSEYMSNYYLWIRTA